MRRPILTPGEIALALIRDHLTNRHARRAAVGCPVCAHAGADR